MEALIAYETWISSIEAGFVSVHLARRHGFQIGQVRLLLDRLAIRMHPNGRKRSFLHQKSANAPANQFTDGARRWFDPDR